MRGTRLEKPRQVRQRRFIPACAGNAQSRTARNRTPTVHPRVCGEHRPLIPVPSCFPGSSPRVRGTHAEKHGHRERVRFIPACAGNTRSGPGEPVPRPVHPRVCGEHRFHQYQSALSPGSSPRVRGTHGPAGRMLDGLRFIPACAGNTTRSSRHTGDTSVHPRVCGEHPTAPGSPTPRGGSSPRVRGTLFAQHADSSVVSGCQRTHRHVGKLSDASPSG